MELATKKLEILHELLPSAISLAGQPNQFRCGENETAVKSAARTLGRSFHVLHASTERYFDSSLPACLNYEPVRS